jgi:hypothetical protein
MPDDAPVTKADFLVRGIVSEFSHDKNEHVHIAVGSH